MDPVGLTRLNGLACQCQGAGLHICFGDCIQTYERILACRAHISATTVYASPNWKSLTSRALNVCYLLLINFNDFVFCSIDATILHLMKGINNIFRPKGKLSSKLMKTDEISHIIEVNIGVRNCNCIKVSTSLCMY